MPNVITIFFIPKVQFHPIFRVFLALPHDSLDKMRLLSRALQTRLILKPKVCTKTQLNDFIKKNFENNDTVPPINTPTPPPEPVRYANGRQRLTQVLNSFQRSKFIDKRVAKRELFNCMISGCQFKRKSKYKSHKACLRHVKKHINDNPQHRKLALSMLKWLAMPKPK